MRYYCFYCNKSVSTEMPTESMIRATLICPECLLLPDQKKLNEVLEEIATKVSERWNK